MVNGTVRVFDQIARRKHERYTTLLDREKEASCPHCFVVFEGVKGGTLPFLKCDKNALI